MNEQTAGGPNWSRRPRPRMTDGSAKHTRPPSVAKQHGRPASVQLHAASDGSYASWASSNSRISGPHEPEQEPSSPGDHLVSMLTTAKSGMCPQSRGLPVAHLLPHVQGSSTYYVLTTVDDRGRLADRSPLRELGWQPGHSISTIVFQGIIIVVTCPDGPEIITRQGHLRLPTPVRLSCRLKAGTRLLVAASRNHDLLSVYTTSALDTMLLAYHASLRSEVDR